MVFNDRRDFIITCNTFYGSNKKPLTCRAISGREIWYLARVPCAWKTPPITRKYNRGKISEKKYFVGKSLLFHVWKVFEIILQFYIGPSTRWHRKYIVLRSAAKCKCNNMEI